MSSRSQPSTEGGRAANAPDPTPRKSFHIESLGCAKNQVDSELIIAALERDGWTRAASEDDAGVLIVNTCGFISSAKKESIETTLGLKKRHPDKRVIMAGCLTERYGADLKRELPEIDAILGNKDPQSIVDAVEGRAGAETRPATVSRPYERLSRRPRTCPTQSGTDKTNLVCRHSAIPGRSAAWSDMSPTCLFTTSCGQTSSLNSSPADRV